MRARASVPKFVEDSNYETEAADISTETKKRRRIIRKHFDSSSDEEAIPIRKKAKATIPAPPPVTSTKSLKMVGKGHGPTKEELKKKEKDELMARLVKARAAAQAKMTARKTIQKSPWKVTPSKKNVCHVTMISCVQCKFPVDLTFYIFFVRF